MKHLHHLIILVLAVSSVMITAHAQTAPPLDAAAVRATLGQKPKRFIGKGAVAPVVKRTFGKTAKGVDVEIVERADGRREERPYVAVPILFEKDSDELLDEVSRSNVSELAGILRDFLGKGAHFTIQGHASAEGDPIHNKTLSDKRAAKILSLLARSAGVDAGGLQARGFGAECATASPGAPEAERQKDRRVLVVKD